MLKKSSDFFGWTNSEVVIFLGIKYKPLSDPPVCEWGPCVKLISAKSDRAAREAKKFDWGTRLLKS